MKKLGLSRWQVLLKQRECPADPAIDLAQGEVAFLCGGEWSRAALPLPGGCPAQGCAALGIEGDPE